MLQTVNSKYCERFNWHVDNKLFAFQLTSWIMDCVHFVFAELNSSKCAITDLRVTNGRTIGYFGDGSIRTVDKQNRMYRWKKHESETKLDINRKSFLILSVDASLTRSWTLKNLPEKIESFWCSFNSVLDAVIYAKWKLNLLNLYLSLERRPRGCIHEKIHGNNSFCYSKARNSNRTWYGVCEPCGCSFSHNSKFLE